MDILVGYTGFVGSNLYATGHFDYVFNSSNVMSAYGLEPDLLIYSGIRAEKFLANSNPTGDFENIQQAIYNISQIKPKKIVLISTIDVFKNVEDVDEDTPISLKGLHAYGRNRFYLEQWVEQNIGDHLIVRLPALYGKNLKKNFIYDYIHVIPTMLNEEKFYKYCENRNDISCFYSYQPNGFYKCKELTLEEVKKLKNYFNEIQFSAVNFTDSRGIYQFYPLRCLYDHIKMALTWKIKKLHLATEPILISELYQSLCGRMFMNTITATPPKYNFKTKYAHLFLGENGYIFSKAFIIDDIRKFVQNEEKRI